MSPSSIGKYRILESLGRGAMGEVYLGVDPLLGRRVAIKVMRGAGPELAERFLHEARIVASLTHPNIVGLLEFGFEAGEPFFAMEYLAGESLDAWRRQPRALSETLLVVEGMLAALGHAHANGVLHRDVKPSNVQVMPDGSAKLMDFGVAHTDAARLTATGAVMGTPAYMAPELVAGEPSSVRTDVYAAGVVLYELLAGWNPFQGPSVAAVLSKVLQGSPPPLSEVRPGLPGELCDLVTCCMARDPEQRPAGIAPVLGLVRRLRSSTGARDAAPETIALRGSLAPTASAEGQPRRQARLARPLGVGILLTVLASLGAWWLLAPRPGGTDPGAQPTASAQPAPTAAPAAPPATVVESAPPRGASPASLLPSPRPARAGATPAAGPPPTQPAGSPRPELAPSVPASASPLREAPLPASPPPPAAQPAPTESAPPPAPEGPRLESLAPASVRRGASGRLEIRGAGFRSGLRVVVLHGRRPAVGIVISGQRLVSAGRISCTVSVDSDVSIDAYSVVLLDPEGTPSNGLTLEVTL